jgi:hypothetical protein
VTAEPHILWRPHLDNPSVGTTYDREGFILDMNVTMDQAERRWGKVWIVI